MTGEEGIYDFETAMEDAFAAALTAAGLVVTTPRTAAQFAKERPRVELEFLTGAENQSYHNVNGLLRSATWQGQLIVEIITGSASTGNESHRTYRAKVRRKMADLRNDAINEALLYHKIQNLIDQGTTPAYRTDDGYEKSRLQYSVPFGIDHAAWAALEP